MMAPVQPAPGACVVLTIEFILRRRDIRSNLHTTIVLYSRRDPTNQGLPQITRATTANSSINPPLLFRHIRRSSPPTDLHGLATRGQRINPSTATAAEIARQAPPLPPPPSKAFYTPQLEKRWKYYTTSRPTCIPCPQTHPHSIHAWLHTGLNLSISAAHK
jgi:hypothetical protein